MHQTVDARLINGLWIMVSYICGWNKTRKKVCWLQIYAGIISHMAHPNVVRLYQRIEELVGVLFYNQFHYRICFNSFQYEIRF